MHKIINYNLCLTNFSALEPSVLVDKFTHINSFDIKTSKRYLFSQVNILKHKINHLQDKIIFLSYKDSDQLSSIFDSEQYQTINQKKFYSKLCLEIKEHYDALMEEVKALLVYEQEVFLQDNIFFDFNYIIEILTFMKAKIVLVENSLATAQWKDYANTIIRCRQQIINNVLQANDYVTTIIDCRNEVNVVKITTINSTKLVAIVKIINNMLFETRNNYFIFTSNFFGIKRNLAMKINNKKIKYQWLPIFKKEAQQLFKRNEQTIRRAWSEKNKIDKQDFNFFFNYFISNNSEIAHFFFKILTILEIDKIKNFQKLLLVLEMLRKDFANYFELLLMKNLGKTNFFLQKIAKVNTENDEIWEKILKKGNEKSTKNKDATVLTTEFSIDTNSTLQATSSTSDEISSITSSTELSVNANSTLQATSTVSILSSQQDDVSKAGANDVNGEVNSEDNNESKTNDDKNISQVLYVAGMYFLTLTIIFPLAFPYNPDPTLLRMFAENAPLDGELSEGREPSVNKNNEWHEWQPYFRVPTSESGQFEFSYFEDFEPTSEFEFEMNLLDEKMAGKPKKITPKKNSPIENNEFPINKIAKEALLEKFKTNINFSKNYNEEKNLFFHNLLIKVEKKIIDKEAHLYELLENWRAKTSKEVYKKILKLTLIDFDMLMDDLTTFKQYFFVNSDNEQTKLFRKHFELLVDELEFNIELLVMIVKVTNNLENKIILQRDYEELYAINSLNILVLQGLKVIVFDSITNFIADFSIKEDFSGQQNLVYKNTIFENENDNIESLIFSNLKNNEKGTIINEIKLLYKYEHQKLKQQMQKIFISHNKIDSTLTFKKLNFNLWQLTLQHHLILLQKYDKNFTTDNFDEEQEKIKFIVKIYHDNNNHIVRIGQNNYLKVEVTNNDGMEPPSVMAQSISKQSFESKNNTSSLVSKKMFGATFIIGGVLLGLLPFVVLVLYFIKNKDSFKKKSPAKRKPLIVKNRNKNYLLQKKQLTKFDKTFNAEEINNLINNNNNSVNNKIMTTTL